MKTYIVKVINVICISLIIRYSLFVIRYSLFVIRYSLFVIRYSLFVIRYSLQKNELRSFF
ncbi:MAG: hypothetical protein COA88_08660 [Kordia sp.]|nr:MAG: hypothetical protein COA88_08660 [Kordia sp.]